MKFLIFLFFSFALFNCTLQKGYYYVNDNIVIVYRKIKGNKHNDSSLVFEINLPLNDSTSGYNLTKTSVINVTYQGYKKDTLKILSIEENKESNTIKIKYKKKNRTKHQKIKLPRVILTDSTILDSSYYFNCKPSSF